MASQREHTVLIAGASVHRPLTLLDVDANDWDDWRWGGQGVNPVGSASPAVLTAIGANEWHYLFANGNYMVFHDLQIPHDYAEGTNILPHIHVGASTANAATGTFTMRWNGVLTAGNGVAPETELVLTAAISIPSSKARYGYLFDFDGVIPGAGRQVSSCGTISLTYALTSGDGIIIRGFDGHYQKDRLGSRSATGKT